MLLLYEDHAVVGRKLDQFEGIWRDEWMPLFASCVDGRLLWYFDRLLGEAHHVVTVCALRDAESHERFVTEMRSGKLADVAEEFTQLRYGVSGKLLNPTAWCPPIVFDDVGTSPVCGEVAVFLENVAWPDEPLQTFTDQLGASYQQLWSGASGGGVAPVELVVAAHTIPPGPGPQMTVLQRVNDPIGLLGNIVVKLAPDHPIEQAKAKGLEHRDRFASNLLMTATWSPCR